MGCLLGYKRRREQTHPVARRIAVCTSMPPTAVLWVIIDGLYSQLESTVGTANNWYDNHNKAHKRIYHNTHKHKTRPSFRVAVKTSAVIYVKKEISRNELSSPGEKRASRDRVCKLLFLFFNFTRSMLSRILLIPTIFPKHPIPKMKQILVIRHRGHLRTTTLSMGPP